MTYLIKNGRVIDPENNIDEVMDIFVKDGKVEKTAKAITDKADEVIDAKNMIVAPGFIDMHTHLREPGREDKETIRSGTRAAVKGGFTTVACMPNTDIPIDSIETVKLVKDIAKKDAIANVVVIAAITEKRQGKKLSDIKALKAEGVAAISDDGCSVEDKEVLLAALKESKKEKVLLIEHCEDPKLAGTGVMNKGFTSTKMGLRGISNASEYEMVKRDIELAKKAGARLHIAHVSTKESVELIRRAKKDGIDVTAETCPHYLALTDECCGMYDTNMKMNPPLRTKEDVKALKEGLKDGTIDVIATDHAPHTDSEKDVEFDYAPFGVIGLETALSISVMELVAQKVLTWPELISKLASNPAKILGLDKGTLKKGAGADIVIFDPEKEYTYTKVSIESKSKNSPFINWMLKGKVTHVLVGGKLVMKDETIT
jgi:dihydroorotase